MTPCAFTGPEVLAALAAHKKATAVKVEAAGKTAEATRFNSTRLAFGKDKSFDLWELNDNSGGKKGKPEELSERVASMRSVNDVWKALKGYVPGKETVDAQPGRSPMWRRENEKDVHLVCGPTHD